MAHKVLVGEDNLVTQQVLKAMLENKRAVVTLASTSEEILAHLEKDAFDFLLLDFHLDQDGDQVVAEIRKSEFKNKHIPIYILSAGKETDMMSRLKQFEISGFIKKPLQSSQLDKIMPTLDSKPINNDQADNLLTSLIGNDKERINTINQYFIEEVPHGLKLILEHLKGHNLQEVQRVLHRIRPAYTYVGRDDIQVKLEKWEDEIGQGTSSDNNLDLLHATMEETVSILAKFPSHMISKKEESHSASNNKKEKLLGFNILVVDDSEVFQSVFTSFLKVYGLKTAKALNGLDGVTKTIQQNPDLILMDIHMPVMNGVDAIAKIRAEKINTPLLAMSNTVEHKDAAISAGANTFLLKPIAGEDLLDSIINHLA